MITVKVDDIAILDLNRGTKMEAIAAIVQSEPTAYQAGLLEGAKLMIIEELQNAAIRGQNDVADTYAAKAKIEAIDTTIKPA